MSEMNEPNRNAVHCDVLIIGAGPAGLTAAIYTSRSRLRTIVIDSSLPGGQVATTYHVANYPGTDGIIGGLDLMQNMQKQAQGFGAQIDDSQQIQQIDLQADEKFIRTDKNDYYAKTVIVATGAQPRKLPVATEEEYRGKGVHYCATCDGAFYQDADIAVVGGGVSALEEAEFLCRFAKSVTILNRRDQFRAAKQYTDEVFHKNPQISVMWNTTIAELKGDPFLQSVVLANSKTGERTEVNIEGVFVYIGMEPSTELFKGQLNLDEWGYVITDEKMATNLPGVFAAGDVRVKDVRQISTAVGDGTVAGIMAERYLISK